MSVDLPIDHLVVLVPDLAAARAAFAEGGFTATPIARHSAQMGTANSCIMLEGSYIELMGMIADTPANENWRALLAAGPGLKGVALASDDIAQTAATLAKMHVETDAPRDFSRAMPEGELRFSVIRLPRGLTPGLQCIYCQHHTRDLLWTPSATRHANGARRMIAAQAIGVAALRPFAVDEKATAVPMREGKGSITIELDGGIGDAALVAIERTAGISLIPRMVA